MENTTDALAAEVKRRKTHANSEAMLAGFGLGPEGKTCGECYYFGTSVATGRHACFAFPKPQGRWHKSWPACGRWRE